MPRIDLPRLRQRCLSEINALVDSDKQFVVGGNTKDGYYAFKDNGSQVLAVAHADCKVCAEHFACDGGIVFCTQLDDRLGVYTIMDYLPSLGIVPDVLLTDRREEYQSTAKLFIPHKVYNWMVSFDDDGVQAATCNSEFNDIVKPFFHVGYGVPSDLGKLDFLECEGLDVGIGYHDEHRISSYMFIAEYRAQLARFREFWTAYSGTAFPHPLPKWKRNGGHGGSHHQRQQWQQQQQNWKTTNDEEDERNWVGESVSAVCTCCRREILMPINPDDGVEYLCPYCNTIVLKAKSQSEANYTAMTEAAYWGGD